MNPEGKTKVERGNGFSPPAIRPGMSGILWPPILNRAGWKYGSTRGSQGSRLKAN